MPIAGDGVRSCLLVCWWCGTPARKNISSVQEKWLVAACPNRKQPAQAGKKQPQTTADGRENTNAYQRKHQRKPA